MFALKTSSLTLIAVILTLGWPSPAQTNSPPPRVAGGAFSRPSSSASQPSDVKRRLDAFQKTWQVLNDHYYDRTFNSLNWAGIRAEYEPRVRAAKSDLESHRIIQEMLNRLGSSHLAIIYPEVFAEIDRAKAAAQARNDKRSSLLLAGTAIPDEEVEELSNFDDPLSKYGIGIDLRVIDGEFVITRVEKGSAGEYAGLKSGFVVDKINDLVLADLYTRLTVYYFNSRSLLKQIPVEIAEAFLNGEKDSNISITYRDAANQEKVVLVRRELLPGQTITVGKNFPEKRLQFAAEPIGNDVGYVRFSHFALPIIANFCTALDKFKTKKGLIIDLRGNSGGIIASTVGLSGMLSRDVVDLGTSIYKRGEEKLVAQPKEKHYDGKLVILVDETTASAAEMFAVSMQDSGRASVIGERTAGATLPSMVVELRTGAMLQYPIANYRSSKGEVIEGRGVTPDQIVSLDRKNLSAGKDTQLEAAVAFINREDPKPAPERKFTVKGNGSGSGIAAPPPPAKQGPATGGRITGGRTPVAAPQPVRDAKAVQVINEFLDAIGGQTAITALESYEAIGRVGLNLRGSEHSFQLTISRKSADKYSEVMSSAAMGEIREVYNGRNYLMQTDYGLMREATLPAAVDLSWLEIFGPIKLLAKDGSFSSLKYAGTYDRDGRKVHLVDARSKAGSPIAFTFDVESKMLSYYTGLAYGIVFGDYRKVGNLTLPFSVEREHIMVLKFDSVKVNSPIADDRFSKKVNCFDVPLDPKP